MISRNETVINRNYTVEIKTPSITAKVLYTTFTFMKKDGTIDCDVDVMEYKDVTFMGMPIDSEDYKAIQKLRDNLREMGINMDKVITSEAERTFDKGYVLRDVMKEALIIFGR